MALEIFPGEDSAEVWKGADLFVKNPSGMGRMRDFETAGFSYDEAAELAELSFEVGMAGVKQQLAELARTAELLADHAEDSKPRGFRRLPIAGAIARTLHEER